MSQENPNTKQRLIRYVKRQQMSWRAVDVDHLIDEDHQARAIWAMVGRLNLSAFYQAIASSAEEGGRPAIDPQLLISLWVYAYSRGIGAAREVARRCEYDPAFQWLTGLEGELSHAGGFSRGKAAELDELFTNLLGVLSAKGLITLEEVMQDGTKIKAGASSRSFHREKTMRDHLDRARRHVRRWAIPGMTRESESNKPARDEPRREGRTVGRSAAGIREVAGEKERKKKRGARVSTSDPQARVMKHPAGIRAELQRADFYRCSAGTDCGSDGDPGGQRHGTVIASGGPRGTATEEKASTDGGRQRLHDAREYREDGWTRSRFSGDHATRRCAAWSQPEEPVSTERISLSAGEEPLCLPGGQSPASAGTAQGGAGMTYHIYEARFEDCRSCPRKPECCPDNKKNGRSVAQLEESPVVIAFRKKMAGEEARKQYRRRGRIVEFCHAWIKSKLGLRQFHVRGLAKVQMEMLWACLTYNLQFWIRLSKAHAQHQQSPERVREQRRGPRHSFAVASHQSRKPTLNSQSHSQMGFLHSFIRICPAIRLSRG